MALLFAIAAPSYSYAADGIPVVTITKTGPDRPLPLGSAFQITGEVDKDVKRVRPVLVRSWSPWLFDSRPRGCDKVEENLGPPKPMDWGSGTVSASNVWGSAKAGDYKALIPAAWSRTDEKDKATFKVLIPNDTEFFQTGASYCLFVYQEKVSVDLDKKSVKRVIDTWANKISNCRDEKCTAEAQQEYNKGLEEAFKKQKDSAKKAGIDAANELVTVGKDLRSALSTVDALFDEWTPIGANEPKAFAKPPVVDAVLPSAGAEANRLGRALMIQLSLQGSLHPQIDGANRERVYFTRDGKVKVDAVGILANHGLRVFERPKKNAYADLDSVTTGDLFLRGGDVSTRDVLEFLAGRVRLGKDYLFAKQIRDKLRPTLRSTGKISGDGEKTIDELVQKLRALDDAILRSLAASAAELPKKEDKKGQVAPALPMQGTLGAVEADLGAWMRGYLIPCDDAQLEKWINDKAKKCFNKAAHSKEGWPNFPSGDSPIGFLAKALESVKDERNNWVAREEEIWIKVEKTEVEPIAETFGATIPFSQENWVFSYLTPVAGVALLMAPEDKFTLPYIGVQLHFVPNPIDEPQWTGGLRDFARAFAIEVAMATGNGPWGQDNRFQGWKKLPPIFAGLAFHPFPYTSVSAGFALMERRSSTVTQEQYKVFLSGYVGFNVQLNIPDLVVAVKGRTSTTGAGK